MSLKTYTPILYGGRAARAFLGPGFQVAVQPHSFTDPDAMQRRELELAMRAGKRAGRNKIRLILQLDKDKKEREKEERSKQKASDIAASRERLESIREALGEPSALDTGPLAAFGARIPGSGVIGQLEGLGEQLGALPAMSAAEIDRTLGGRIADLGEGLGEGFGAIGEAIGGVPNAAADEVQTRERVKDETEPMSGRPVTAQALRIITRQNVLPTEELITEVWKKLNPKRKTAYTAADLRTALNKVRREKADLIQPYLDPLGNASSSAAVPP